MDQHRFPLVNLPGTLYRVDFPGSRTKYNQAGCLLAADKEKTYDEDKIDDLKRDILDHYLWRPGRPSPFISLFSTRVAAESWASEEPWRDEQGPLTPPHMDWTISVLDVSKLGKSVFFRLKDLMEVLGLDNIPLDGDENEWCQYYAENTYLCLHRVPAGGILEKLNAEEVGQRMSLSFYFKGFPFFLWGMLTW